MIEIRPRETVILAENFSTLVGWYRDALGFTIVQMIEDDFHYCNLVTRSGIKIGIASAAEMGVVPIDRTANTVLLQFEVDHLPNFFEYLQEKGASITGGPSFDKSAGFWFGGFTDPEGNPFWAVDKNCP